jgi:outer membrane receptor for ferrienterochelin and colicins
MTSMAVLLGMWLHAEVEGVSADSVATVPVAAENPTDSVVVDSIATEIPAQRMPTKSVQAEKPRSDSALPWRPVTVSRETIDRSAANNLIDLLDGMPGLLKKIDCSICNTAQIRLLGLSGAYTQILIDGMPSYSGLGLIYGIEQLSLAHVERVEVIQGAGHVKHGGGAVAGAINVITAKPKANPEATAAVRYGEHNEQDYEGSYSGQTGPAGRLGLQFGFSKNSSPAIDVDDDGVDDAAEFDRSSFAGRVSTRLGSRYSLFYGFQSAFEDRFGGTEAASRRTIGEFQPESTFTGSFGQTVTRPLVYQEAIRSQRVAYEAGVKAAYTDALDHEVRASFVEHYQDGYYGYLHLEAKQRLAMVASDLTWHLDKHEIWLGGSYVYDSFRDNRSLGLHAYHIPSLYVQDLYQPWSSLRLQLGLRNDWHSVHGLIASPRAGAQWDMLPGLSWRTTLGAGFRTFNLFSEDHSAVTTDVYYVEPVGDLKPERSFSALTGLEWMALTRPEQGLSLVFDLSAHQTVIGDFLQAYYLQSFTVDGRQRVRYVNMDGTVTVRGLQFTADTRLPFDLELNAGFNLFDHEHDQGDSQGRLFNTPDYVGFASAAWRPMRWGIGLSGEASLVGPQRLREVRLMNTVVQPERDSRPYALFDAALEKRFGFFTVTAGAKNIGDFFQAQREPVLYTRGYQVATNSVFAPLKGRTVYLDLRLRLKASTPTP